MDIKIIIKRQKDSRSAPYIQEFIYTGDGRLTVADFLSVLNTRTPLLTADGKETKKINYASSFLKKTVTGKRATAPFNMMRDNA